MEGNESAWHRGQRQGWKDISPQSETPFCEDILWNRKKPVKISGYPGTQGY